MWAKIIAGQKRVECRLIVKELVKDGELDGNNIFSLLSEATTSIIEFRSDIIVMDFNGIKSINEIGKGILLQFIKLSKSFRPGIKFILEYRKGQYFPYKPLKLPSSSPFQLRELDL